MSNKRGPTKVEQWANVPLRERVLHGEGLLVPYNRVGWCDDNRIYHRWQDHRCKHCGKLRYWPHVDTTGDVLG